MAFPVTLNGRTYTLADFSGTNYVEGFPDALEDFVTQAGDIYNSTSTTSNTIGTGSKTFTVVAGKPYQAGTPLRIADAAAPATNFLDAIVTSYSGTSLVVNVFGFAGSGTYTSWTVNIGGAKTADGTLPVAQGGTGATTAADARTSLDIYSKGEADSRFLNVSGEASNVVMNGNVTIGDSGTDTLTVNATATLADATLTTADINGGTIDGTVIGGSTPAAISGTTGTFSGNLTVDTNTLFVDTANNRVGIGTSSLAQTLQLESSGSAFLRAKSTFPSTSFTGVDIGQTTEGHAIFLNRDAQPMRFFTSDTERARIDSSGALLVGGTSYSGAIAELNSMGILPDGSFSPRLSFNNSFAGTKSHLLFFYNSTEVGSINTTTTATSYNTSTTSGVTGVDANTIAIRTNGTERLRITSTGSVLAGTTTLSTGSSAGASRLDIVDGGTFGGVSVSDTVNNSTNKIGHYTGRHYTNTEENILGLRIGSTVGSSDVVIGGGSGLLNAATSIQFYTAANTTTLSGTQRMTLDASGNLLVGKTTISSNDIGVELRATGLGTFTRSSAESIYANRKTSDGDIIKFAKDGTTVGSIGVLGSDIYHGSGDTGLKYYAAGDAIHPFNTSTLANRDNAIDLGLISIRFDDIYATNGTIQTSDRNEKQDIEALSEAEQRVAVACKGLLRKFRWKDAVEEKGDDARIHFGIIAQDLQAAFEAEGLDAGRYAMFIHSTWTDEETGEERSRMGVRYPQLLAFIIAAI